MGGVSLGRLLIPLGIIAVVALSATGFLAGRGELSGLAAGDPARPGDSSPATQAASPGRNDANATTPSPLGKLLSNSLMAGDRTIEGAVTDALTNEPLRGVRVTAGGASALTDEAGRYRLTRLLAGERITFAANGYAAHEDAVADSTTVDVSLEPRLLKVVVRDAYTGGPVVDAVASAESRSARSDNTGTAAIGQPPAGARVTVEADGYAPAEVAANGEIVEVRLRPSQLRGQVLDARSRAPIPGAQVQIAGQTLTTDRHGTYQLDNPLEEVTVEVYAKGYVRARSNAARTRVWDVRLEPQIVKGIYLSYFAAGNDELRRQVIDLIKRTELNALVIDVKGDRAKLLFPMDVPLAKSIGALDNVMIDDIDAFIRDLHANNIYVIARVVTFKDTQLAKHRPEWAIIDKRTGKPWIDDEDLAWVDPFRTEVWDYNVALAVEIAKHGFDEIQWDYIRFPTDGSVSSAVYSKDNTEASRVAALTGFLGRVREALKPYPIAVAIDTFGYTTWRDDDMGIGQHIEELAPYIDYLCPMVYPSTYASGIPGVPNPVANPYEIVKQSTANAIRRLAGTGARVRPWLQDFNDYAFDRRPYGVKEVKAQIQAADDVGAAGWLLWDPRNRYTAGALGPKPGR